MHIPSIVTSHLFSEAMHHLAQYKLLTIFMGILACWFVCEVNTSYRIFTATAERERPLTHLDDPQFIHEYSTRSQGIHDRLDLLRAQTRADRAYLVTYEYGFSSVRKTRELIISRMFAAEKHGVLSTIPAYQGVARQKWLHITRSEFGILGGFFPAIRTGIGMEVYNVSGTPVGYLGIEYSNNTRHVQDDAMKFLRQTVIVVKASLLEPLEDGKSVVDRR